MKLLLTTVILLNVFISCNAQKQLDIGDTIPMFTLQNQDGKTFSMKDSIGKKMIVIFFYPKDESIVCTKEACTFRDSASEFVKYGALVIGINQGSVESHKKFQQDDNLPYQLLSDPDEKVIKAFGVKATLFTDRVTYVVDKTGVIVFKYHGLTEGSKHPEQVLQYLREAKK
jgi:peroxiredoxin Q/BCP